MVAKNRQLPSTAPHRHKSHKLIWFIVFAILIAIATIIIINLFQPLHPDQPTPSDDTTSESSASASVKGDSDSTKSESSKDLDPLIEEKTPTQHEGPSANASASLTGSISYIDTSTRGQLSVRVNIDQFLEDGSCTLYLTQNGNYYYFEVPIILSASTATCRGFDIDTTDIPSGDYDLRIDLSSGEKTGAINGKVSL